MESNPDFTNFSVLNEGLVFNLIRSVKINVFGTVYERTELALPKV